MGACLPLPSFPLVLFSRSLFPTLTRLSRSLEQAIYSPRALLEARKRENSVVIFICFKLDISFIRKLFSIQLALI